MNLPLHNHTFENPPNSSLDSSDAIIAENIPSDAVVPVPASSAPTANGTVQAALQPAFDDGLFQYPTSPARRKEDRCSIRLLLRVATGIIGAFDLLAIMTNLAQREVLNAFAAFLCSVILISSAVMLSHRPMSQANNNASAN